MAICPQCNGAMGTVDVVCPHCGFDFPEDTSPDREGFAYSVFADVALVISMVAAGFGCVFAAFGAFVLLLSGQLLAMCGAVIAFFLQLGMLVVFMRVSDK